MPWAARGRNRGWVSRGSPPTFGRSPEGWRPRSTRSARQRASRRGLRQVGLGVQAPSTARQIRSTARRPQSRRGMAALDCSRVTMRRRGAADARQATGRSREGEGTALGQSARDGCSGVTRPLGAVGTGGRRQQGEGREAVLSTCQGPATGNWEMITCLSIVGTAHTMCVEPGEGALLAALATHEQCARSV